MDERNCQAAVPFHEACLNSIETKACATDNRLHHSRSSPFHPIDRSGGISLDYNSYVLDPAVPNKRDYSTSIQMA